MNLLWTGYRVTPLGALFWVPPGWKHTPPVALTPVGQTPESLERAQAEHARRIERGELHPPDWPPYLIAHHPSRGAAPWRLVMLDPLTAQRAGQSWHASKAAALAAGDAATVRCA